MGVELVEGSDLLVDNHYVFMKTDPLPPFSSLMYNTILIVLLGI